MDWSKGYSASYYMSIVDPATWRDIATVRIKGGTVARAPDGLMHSANVECTEFDRNSEKWVRIYLDTAQQGAHAHEALFTGLATSPEEAIVGWRSSSELECFSVLKPCSDVYLPRGWYAPTGIAGGSIIAELLGVTPAPVTVADGSPALQSAIIAEDDETNLTMIEKILTAINWRLRITGNGAISVEAKPIEAVAIFDPVKNDVIENEIDVSADWYSCPNVLRCIYDDLTAVARDDNPRSKLSTVNRGREVWANETDCDLGVDESIGEYAQRRLAELQQVELVAEYTRRYMPSVMPGDLIIMHYPAQGLEGQFEVSKQDIDLGYAARTGEEIRKYIDASAMLEVETEVGLRGLIDDNGDNLVDDNGDRLIVFDEL